MQPDGVNSRYFKLRLSDLIELKVWKIQGKLQGYPQRMRRKDDLKLIKYDDNKVKLRLLPLIMSFNGLFIDMATKKASWQW